MNLLDGPQVSWMLSWMPLREVESLVLVVLVITTEIWVHSLRHWYNHIHKHTHTHTHMNSSKAFLASLSPFIFPLSSLNGNAYGSGTPPPYYHTTTLSTTSNDDDIQHPLPQMMMMMFTNYHHLTVHSNGNDPLPPSQTKTVTIVVTITSAILATTTTSVPTNMTTPLVPPPMTVMMATATTTMTAPCPPSWMKMLTMAMDTTTNDGDDSKCHHCDLDHHDHTLPTILNENDYRGNCHHHQDFSSDLTDSLRMMMKSTV